MKKITPLLIFLCLFCLLKANSSTNYQLEVIVYGSPSSLVETNSTGYSINGAVQEYSGNSAQPSIHVAVIDSVSCGPINNCNSDVGQFNIFNDPDGDCILDGSTIYTDRARPENYFIFRSPDNSQMQSMAAFINSIADGNFILIYNWFPSTYSTMDASFDNALLGLGATVIPSLADSLPFIFFCKKGDVGSVQEVVGALPNSLITLNTSYACSPTGIDEISSASFHVYPNPASDNFRIEFPGKGDIKMFDATGRIIFQKPDVQNNIVVRTSDLASGIYYLEFTNSKKNICKKVAVCRE